MPNTRLDELKAVFSSRNPYCSGTCHVPAEHLTLFYSHGEDEAARRVDLSKASEGQLESLSRACQPATFGRNQEDVLDETYRKAGKLDLEKFSCHFDPTRAGIVNHIRNELLVGDQKLELELYKLNVYEKDGFFKAHQDTPRGEKMFGSLVVVFPTLHEGGELILRHDGNEWVIDFSDAFKQASQPSVGYITFFSDIEHEVAPVRSGYRVTLTYNLYFGPPNPAQKTLPSVSPQEGLFEAALVELIHRPDILPDGGYLGLGLQYQYPVTSKKKLSVSIPFLKGSDAVLANVCNHLSLNWSLKVLYAVKAEFSNTVYHVLMGRIPRYNSSEEQGVLRRLERDGGKRVTVVRESSSAPRGPALRPRPEGLLKSPRPTCLPSGT